MRDLLLNNLWLKLFSLVLATLIWFVVEANLHRGSKVTTSPFPKETTLELRCPVAVLVTAPFRQVYTVEPREVDVKLVGNSKVLTELNPMNLLVYVKIGEPMLAGGLVPVEVKLPTDVHLVALEPLRVTVTPLSPN